MSNKCKTVTLHAEVMASMAVGAIIEYINNMRKVTVVDVTAIYQDYYHNLQMEFPETPDDKLFRLFQIITEIVTVRHSYQLLPNKNNNRLDTIVEYVIEEIEYSIHEKYGFNLAVDIGLITTATELNLSIWDISRTSEEDGYFAMPLNWERQTNKILLHTGLITWDGILRGE